MAPTGTAASIIGGSTIHAGLGIKVKKKEKNSLDNTLYIYTSVKNRNRLRDEWKTVDFIMIDEISMVSAELLCEIDHALRYAKENYNDWFGGVNMIFSGDFYQFPPVGSSPLYNPIMATPKHTSRDISRRLGRLAWKSVDTVIELTEQQRMKNDPEFACAVNRQRVRQCIPPDEDLFNSRTIKSPSNPDGIDLSTRKEDIIALVHTNEIREALNHKKALSISHQNSANELIPCAAKDFIDGHPVPPHLINHILHLNVNANRSRGKRKTVLPGVIPLCVEEAAATVDDAVGFTTNVSFRLSNGSA